MGQIDVLIGEVQKMPRAFPGPEGAKRDAGVLLEQMQEARGGQPGLRRTAGRSHGLARKPTDLRDRPHQPRIERARWQRFAKTHHVERGADDVLAASPTQQLLISGADTIQEEWPFSAQQAPRKQIECPGADGFTGSITMQIAER